MGEDFAGQAIFVGIGEEMGGLRIAVYPGAFTVDSAMEIKEKLERSVIDHIIQVLTNPLEGEERSGKSDQKKTVYKGTFEDVNRYFQEVSWSDGLPVVPPTVNRIEEFLKYTDRSPDEEVAIIPQAGLRATPWTIAANAVMAGCRPELMPLLIAITEAMGDPYFNMRDLGTTMMIIPYAIVNGPIVKQLGITYDVATISRGPNPSIGRAIGLMVRNIGGFKPGENYMASFGYPALGFAVAEDEEGSPWEPFHAGKGFDRTASTVTLGGTMNWGYQAVFPVPEEIEAMALGLARHMDGVVTPYITWMEHDQNMVMVFVTSPVAQMFSKAGWSKKDLRDFLWENSTITVREVEWRLRYNGLRTSRKPEWWTIRGLIDSKEYHLPEWLDKRGPDEKLPRVLSPDEIHIVVTGARGRDKAQALWSWYNKPTTKEIKVPKNWDDLLKTRREG